MAVPFLMMFVPAWAALRWAVQRPFGGGREPARTPAPLPGTAVIGA